MAIMVGSLIFIGVYNEASIEYALGSAIEMTRLAFLCGCVFS
jgi:hypothetical protein